MEVEMINLFIIYREKDYVINPFREKWTLDTNHEVILVMLSWNTCKCIDSYFSDSFDKHLRLERRMLATAGFVVTWKLFRIISSTIRDSDFCKQNFFIITLLFFKKWLDMMVASDEAMGGMGEMGEGN